MARTPLVQAHQSPSASHRSPGPPAGPSQPVPAAQPAGVTAAVWPAATLEAIAQKDIKTDMAPKTPSRLESLVATAPADYFKLENGIELKSLKDLADYLPKMDDQVFKNHVGENYNHFADWVRGNLKDAQIADKLMQAKTKDAMVQALAS